MNVCGMRESEALDPPCPVWTIATLHVSFSLIIPEHTVAGGLMHTC